jgi:phosphatidylinositol glycan class O
MDLCTARREGPVFQKLILVVIDALRYDFLNPERSVHRDEFLPIAGRLLKEQPSRTVVGKIVADPPTTTMQRVKALMTGTFPTFIDAGSNFFSYAVEEDNLLSQWRAAGNHFDLVPCWGKVDYTVDAMRAVFLCLRAA